MSSKPLYVGLFIVAGLNLSFWGQPLQAERLDRMPASSNCNIASNLLKGQTDMSCSRTETEYDRKAKSDVQITTIYETGANGEKVKKGIEVRTITEANCDSCDISTGTKQSTTVFGVDQLKDFNSVQQQILAAAERQEAEALDELKKEIALKKAVENCTRDSDGNKLEKEEQLECRIEKVADMDDEEAKDYFDKYLKSDLEKKLLSGDASEREEALEALNTIYSETLSDQLENRVESMRAFAKQVSTIDQAKAQAQAVLQQAQAIPDNHPQKQQAMQVAQQQAKALMGRIENSLQTMRMQEFQRSLQGQSSSNLEILDKLEAHLNEAYMSAPELLALKTGASTNTNTGTTGQNGITGNPQDVNNSSRLARGGVNIPGGLLTVIPKATVPQNSSQMNLPNAQNLGRGTAQNRLPAPVNQFQQPITQIQPLPQQVPVPNNGYVYNQFQPMGPQYTGQSGMPTTLPAF